MPYYLDNAFLLDNPWITVVGCGGTGGFVAEGLCRLFQGREATIVLVDHDRVEPHNLLRQNFYAQDVGTFQEPGPRRQAGQGLQETRRLLGLPIPGGLPSRRTPLSRPSRPRRLPHHRLRRQRRSAEGDGRVPAGAPLPLAHRRGQRHQLGAGAGGQRRRPGGLGGTSLRTGETCHLLPAPTLQRPDLLTAVSTRPPDVDCAAALDLTDQDPTINQMMASLALQVVRRMVAGTCPFMALYLDMDLGTVTPSYATPEAVERLLPSESDPEDRAN